MANSYDGAIFRTSQSEADVAISQTGIQNIATTPAPMNFSMHSF